MSQYSCLSLSSMDLFQSALSSMNCPPLKLRRNPSQAEGWEVRVRLDMASLMVDIDQIMSVPGEREEESEYQMPIGDVGSGDASNRDAADCDGKGTFNGVTANSRYAALGRGSPEALHKAGNRLTPPGGDWSDSRPAAKGDWSDSRPAAGIPMAASGLSQPHQIASSSAPASAPSPVVVPSRRSPPAPNSTPPRFAPAWALPSSALEEAWWPLRIPSGPSSRRQWWRYSRQHRLQRWFNLDHFLLLVPQNYSRRFLVGRPRTGCASPPADHKTSLNIDFHQGPLILIGIETCPYFRLPGRDGLKRDPSNLVAWIPFQSIA